MLAEEEVAVIEGCAVDLDEERGRGEGGSVVGCDLESGWSIRSRCFMGRGELG